MKVVYKYTLAIVVSLILCLAIGYAVDYLFNVKIYQWLIVGAIVPVAMARFKKDEKQM